MKKKVVTGITLSLLFIGMLTLAFEIQPVGAETITLRGDVNGDGVVNILDVVIVVSAFGGSTDPECKEHPTGNPYDPRADLNQDGIINIMDLVIVCSNYGKRLPL